MGAALDTATSEDIVSYLIAINFSEYKDLVLSNSLNGSVLSTKYQNNSLNDSLFSLFTENDIRANKDHVQVPSRNRF